MNLDSEHEKKALRKQSLEKQKGIAPDQMRAWSERWCERFLSWLGDGVGVDGWMMVYLPMAGEVDLSAAMVRCVERGIGVCVPRIDWEKRELMPIRVPEEDVVAVFSTHDSEVRGVVGGGGRGAGRGVRQPPVDGMSISGEELDGVVVPGVAFDAAGGRLGRGGGFYDRFLSQLGAKVWTVGATFETMLVDRVPCESHDVLMSHVLTEKRLIVCRSESGS